MVSLKINLLHKALARIRIHTRDQTVVIEVLLSLQPKTEMKLLLMSKTAIAAKNVNDFTYIHQFLFTHTRANTHVNILESLL